MIVAERKIRMLEKQFLARAHFAFADAYKRALDSGLAIVISENGALYRVFPNGKREFLKHLEKPTPISKGQKVKIG